MTRVLATRTPAVEIEEIQRHASIAGIALQVPTYAGTLPATTALGLGQVIVTKLIAARFAWGVLATLERFSRKAHRPWAIAPPATAVGSLLVPLTVSTLARYFPRRVSRRRGSMLIRVLRAL